MQNTVFKTFGCLTLDKNYKKISDLDLLFQNSKKQYEKLNVSESDREIAFENLRKLVSQLQTKRLRYNTKSKSDYFIL